jgi:hypothetical protein
MLLQGPRDQSHRMVVLQEHFDSGLRQAVSYTIEVFVGRVRK